MTNPFTEDYYLRGPETGLSNYTDYKWLDAPTSLLAENIRDVMGMEPPETVLDFGCARGYLVRALRAIGLCATGCELSEWAIKNCDPNVVGLVKRTCSGRYDWVVAKDVLEHIPLVDLVNTVTDLMIKTRKGMLVIVPLKDEKGESYVAPQDRSDSTHVICWTLRQWLLLFEAVSHELGGNFQVQGGYRMKGIKQAAEPFPESTGFFIIKRL